MRRNTLDSYRENRILTANPVALGRILLEETLLVARTARQHLKPEDNFERGRLVSKGMNILTEFMLLIGGEEIPELALRLKQVCDYAHFRMMSAHTHASEEEFNEVIRLLQPILEAWTTVENREQQARRTSVPV